MSRKKIDLENETRLQIDELIQTEALQTNKLTFYPPSFVVSVMEGKGFLVTKDYVIRRYRALGIEIENGLWVKELK